MYVLYPPSELQPALGQSFGFGVASGDATGVEAAVEVGADGRAGKVRPLRIPRSCVGFGMRLD